MGALKAFALSHHLQLISRNGTTCAHCDGRPLSSLNRAGPHWIIVMVPTSEGAVVCAAVLSPAEDGRRTATAAAKVACEGSGVQSLTLALRRSPPHIKRISGGATGATTIIR